MGHFGRRARLWELCVASRICLWPILGKKFGKSPHKRGIDRAGKEGSRTISSGILQASCGA